VTGFVYFIRRGEFGSIKVGYSIDVQKRLTALQTASDLPLYLLGFTKANWAQESEAHEALTPYRKNGEWFENEDFVRQFVAAAVSFGIEQAIMMAESHMKPRRQRCGVRGRIRGENRAAIICKHCQNMQEAIDSR